MLMGGTVLGPGTIFLMLVGAFVAAFKIDNWTSFYYNIIPIILFMIVCFTCKSSIQVFSSLSFFRMNQNLYENYYLFCVFAFCDRQICLSL